MDIPNIPSDAKHNTPEDQAEVTSSNADLEILAQSEPQFSNLAKEHQFEQDSLNAQFEQPFAATDSKHDEEEAVEVETANAHQQLDAADSTADLTPNVDGALVDVKRQEKVEDDCENQEPDENSAIVSTGAALVAEDSLIEPSKTSDFTTKVDKDCNGDDIEDNDIDTATKSAELTARFSEESSDKDDNPDAEYQKTPLQNKTNYISFQTAPGKSLLVDCDKPQNSTQQDPMEFSKDYSTDSLMMSGAQKEAELITASNINDLADLDMPSYSSGPTKGTSSEDKHLAEKDESVMRKISSSSSSTAQTTTSTIHSFCSNSSNLSAVKNLLLCNYSKASHILHWKNPIETGIIFAIGSTIILALTFFSIISVFAYSGLGLIIGASLIRTYKVVAKTFNMPSETRIDQVWNKALALNVTLQPEKMHQLVDSSLGNLNTALVYVKQVLLVEDKVATITFGLFLYVLTYIGAWFNGMTLITLVYISLFSWPLVYDNNKAKIDEYIHLVSKQISTHVSSLTQRITSLASGLGTTAKKQE